MGRWCLDHILAPTVVVLLGGFVLQELLTEQVDSLRHEVHQQLTVIKGSQQTDQKGTGNIAAQIQGSHNVTTQSTSVQEPNRPVFSENSIEGKSILERIHAGSRLLAEARNCRGVPEDKTQQLAKRVDKWGNDTLSLLNGFSKAAAQRFLVNKALPRWYEGCTPAAAVVTNLTAYVDNLRLMIR